MLNATVSHELRGPISLITQNLSAQDDLLNDMKAFKEELLDITLHMSG